MGGSTMLEGCIAHGPWGGPHGKEWVYMPEGFIKKIKISVRYGWVVDSVNYQTYLTTGETMNSFFGGKGGDQTDTICIEYPNEYLMSISGTIGDIDGIKVVMSICFNTNQNRYGPYGTRSGTPFSYDGKGGVIVGFHGRADKYVDAIGVYVMPKSFALGSASTYEDKLVNEVQNLQSQVDMLHNRVEELQQQMREEMQRQLAELLKQFGNRGNPPQ